MKRKSVFKKHFLFKEGESGTPRSQKEIDDLMNRPMFMDGRCYVVRTIFGDVSVMGYDSPSKIPADCVGDDPRGYYKEGVRQPWSEKKRIEYSYSGFTSDR